MSTDIAANLQQVTSNITTAAQRAHRPADHIQLVAVSKTFGPDIIAKALQAGHRCFGENRVQESQVKWPAFKKQFSGIELHLIGPLQTNKVRDAVALFDVIQTVDRLKLARALGAEMNKQGRCFPVYIQVNTGLEEQKAGILPEEADTFIEECLNLGLDVKGLMCIPPIDDEPGVHFGFLRAIAQRNGIKNLSMGMSSDYEIAVAMGATSVRVGSAIFGQRVPHSG